MTTAVEACPVCHKTVCMCDLVEAVQGKPSIEIPAARMTRGQLVKIQGILYRVRKITKRDVFLRPVGFYA